MGLFRKTLFVATGGMSGAVGIKANSKKERIAKASEKQVRLMQGKPVGLARWARTAGAPQRAPRLKPGESLTPNGYVRRADGKVVVPQASLKLINAWKAAGSIAGLTMPEIVGRVGRNADAVPAEAAPNGYSHTWSCPGYTISVLFGPDNRAVGIVNGSERLG